MKVKDLLMVLVCVGVVTVCVTSLLMRDPIYWTPTMDTCKSEVAPRQDLKTHYHADLSCPLLRAEVSDPREIRRVVKQDGMVKQINSTFQATRERCPICTKE